MDKTEIRKRFLDFFDSHKKDNLVICTHGRADADAIASAYALGHIFTNSTIAVPDEMNESAAVLAERLDIRPSVITDLDPGNFDGLVIVDTCSSTLLADARRWNVLLIIDHHQEEGRDIESENLIVDSNSPSTAEIIAPLLGDIDEKVAFAISVAIISDGARFKSARADTFRVLSELMLIAGVPYQELLEVAEPEMSEETKLSVLRAFSRVKVVFISGYLIATSEVGSNESSAASLISEAADVAFVASWKDSEQETRISARARKHVAVPLNMVMSKVGSSLGGAGGGHAKAAGASVKARTEEALQRCIEVFTESSV